MKRDYLVAATMVQNSNPFIETKSSIQNLLDGSVALTAAATTGGNSTVSAVCSSALSSHDEGFEMLSKLVF
jgi:hypothetical protein